MSRALYLSVMTALLCAAPLLAADTGAVRGQDVESLEALYATFKTSGQEAPAWLIHKLFPDAEIDDPSAPAGADRQGGTSPATAVVIPGLPYSDTGSTSRQGGAQNSVPSSAFTTPTLCAQVGAWAAGGARDRSYKFSVTQPTALTVDLCASGYDTAVGIFVDEGGVVGACVARDDDACGTSYRSVINSCELPAGDYFLIVDGYGNSTGNYTLSVSGPCYDQGCPAGYDLAFEMEGNGMDSNGGCNMAVPAFEPLLLNTPFCGTTWADGGVRDTDWYEVVLSASGSISASLRAGCVPMNLVLVDNLCPTPTQLGSIAVNSGALGTMTSGCLAAGTYRLVAVPQGNTGYPSSGLHHYGLEASTAVCYLPCDNPVDIVCGSALEAPAPTANNFTAGSPSCTGYSHNGFDHEYKLLITQECDVTITMDNVGSLDAALLMRSDCLDANSCFAGADATVGGEPEVITAHLLPGIYFVIADFYNNNAGEPYTLTVACTNVVQVGAEEWAASFQLGQAVPNPFNPTTTLSYTMPQTDVARLTVHDLAGRTVATLVDGLVEAGLHSITFDGSQLASGVYLYTFQSGAFIQSQKMVLVK